MSAQRRQRRAHSASRCVLDSGGLTALVGPSQRARAWLRWLVESGGDVIVPTPILAESTTGDAGRDAEVNRILHVLGRAASALHAPGESVARRAGALRYRAKAGDAVDALVASESIGDWRPCVLLTSDPGDLKKLLARHPNVAVRGV